MSNANSVNGNSNSNASIRESLAARLAAARAAKLATAQTKEVVKPDTVTVSEKSAALAAAAKKDSSSNGTQTQTAAATATKSEPKVEETAKQVTATDKSTAQVKTKTITRANYRQSMKESQKELSNVVKNLKKAGVGRRDVYSMIRSANRQANKTIGKEMKQAYMDYRGKKINRSEFTNKLYGSAVKKLDTIVASLKDALAQRTDKKTEAVKENANATKSDNATKEKETKITDAKSAAKANAKKSAEAAKENAKATKKEEKVPTAAELKKKKDGNNKKE